ncbi:hypothetical protein OAB00_00740 [Akkermansiaceae bacterium]|nr:hypothetical protein [Akkermansiaceae bacterium]
MADALWMRIREVNWEEFQTTKPANIPALLKNLASRKLSRAIKASHQIWAALCSGGTVQSAAVPCIPFLVEIFTISDPAVQDTILDILQSVKNSPDHSATLPAYKSELKYCLNSIRDEVTRAKLKDFLAEFE